MKRRTAGLPLALVVGLAASLAALPPAASALEANLQRTNAAPSVIVPRGNQFSDSLASPMADKRSQLRQDALADVLRGQARSQRINGSLVVDRGAKVQGAGRQYVELANERTDRVFVLLVEFGDQRHPDFPDADVSDFYPGPFRFDGPQFNQIPRPAADDNVTIWRPDFDRRYFQKLIFGQRSNKLSLREYYETQSSGRYSIAGDVSAVVRVPYNEARYGRPFEGVLYGAPCTLQSLVCSNTWPLIGDAMKQWVADQKAAGKSDAEIAAYLASFDHFDRYDHDGDGDFNEPDGYLDHVLIVHAGGAREDADLVYGEDAINSHTSYAFYTDAGQTGPAFNPLGGSQIDGTDYWIGDYTIQAENGGLSAIAHEHGHDLGLPDEYDRYQALLGSWDYDGTQGFWTLMCQARLSAPGDGTIGNRLGDLGVWDKLVLGWLDYEVAFAGEDRTIELGPHEYNTSKPQALVVVLPDHPAPIPLPTPPEGVRQWWSGEANSYAASLSRQDIVVPASGATLTMQMAYNIEEDFDAAFVEVESPAGSDDWIALPTSSVDPDAGTAVEDGIDGYSDYVPATFDLAPYAGQTIGLRIRYVTDPFGLGANPSAGWSGVLVDDIAVTSESTTVLADGAESPPNGWTSDGFSSVGATGIGLKSHYYLASYRSYRSFDRYLRSGPFMFGYPSQPKRVDHFPYQDGLLVNYWNTAIPDNDTFLHPGYGLILAVDAHPEVFFTALGYAFPGRDQLYDATFGLQPTDRFVLHAFDAPLVIPRRDAQPVFDDSDPLRFYTPFADAGTPWVGVVVAGAGVRLEVEKQTPNGMTVHLQ
jgi:immune inhibitor A